MATVTETFFSIEIDDMARATAFYVSVFGATVAFATPAWTSVHVARVRLGLALSPGRVAGQTGLHLKVTDLAAACAEVERAGGRLVTAATEVAPGVVIAQVADTEGNVLTLV